MLRGEESRFVLSVFGLNPWSDSPRPTPPSPEESRRHTADRLERFLSGDPACRVRIACSPDQSRAEPSDRPTFTLLFEPWVDGPGRFLPPRAWRGEREVLSGGEEVGGTSALLNVVCRIGPDAACDAWFRFDHVGIDGVPAQQVLTRLESSWGTLAPVAYPAPEEFAALEVPHRCAGRPGIAEVHAFVEFAPLLSWRREQNARLSEPMTVSGALSWRLGRQPELAALHIGSTVEVAPVSGLGSGVGIVSVRPTEYPGGPRGLARFVQDFNRQVALNRGRGSAGCRTLDAMAYMPPRRSAALLRHALDRQPGRFGAVGLTVLRDARVFGAPIAEVGHDRGFIAVGSVNLPTADGRRVGCVSAKGIGEHVSTLPSLIRAAIASAS